MLELNSDLAAQIEALYRDMEESYDSVATPIGLTCEGCPDNCCDSYFLHHTYIEWAYLWYGISKLEPAHIQLLKERSAEYEQQACELLKKGVRPQLMCPLNENGRCTLYHYRLMVCRTHGVPASLTRPDGHRFNFPGCFRAQAIIEQSDDDKVGEYSMERTELMKRLVLLEQTFTSGSRHVLPKVKMTIASMVVAGPPMVKTCLSNSDALDSNFR
ncbi:MAG: hypothetical protein D6B25_09400 [Desulfobulbaceae bacterium]|nr:MAG: hypothetical protein D6B25_09400 [Desulfobulbaceae bacterium]